LVAHPLAAFALLWSSANAATASLTFGMGPGFYLLGVWGDVRQVRFWKKRGASVPGRSV
jgi:hypothetical protein